MKMIVKVGRQSTSYKRAVLKVWKPTQSRVEYLVMTENTRTRFCRTVERFNDDYEMAVKAFKKHDRKVSA